MIKSLRTILRLADFFILIFDKSFFSYLFNTRCFLSFKKERIRYDKNHQVFCLKNSSHKFITNERAYLYINGIAERSNNIAYDYFLGRMKFEENDIIVDCGANVGDLSYYFNNLKINIEYIAIEPSPNEFKILSQNIENNKSIKKKKLFNVALWESDNKSLSFYINSKSADSSIFVPSTGYSKVIKIPTKRLDEILDLNKKYKLLKIDGEGAEPEIIKGADKIINQFTFVTIDCSEERMEISTENKSRLND